MADCSAAPRNALAASRSASPTIRAGRLMAAGCPKACTAPLTKASATSVENRPAAAIDSDATTPTRSDRISTRRGPIRSIGTPAIGLSSAAGNDHAKPSTAI